MFFKNNKLDSDIQNLLLSISRQFIYVTPSEIDKTINMSLKFIAEFLNTERCYIYLFNTEKKSLSISHQFLKKDISPKINHHEQVDGDDFTWLMENLKKLKPLVVNNVNKIPSFANTYKLICNAEKIQSMLLCPLIIEKELYGFIGADALKKIRTWRDEEIYLLNYTADIFSGALNRKNAVERGKQTEQKLKTLFYNSDEVIFITSPEGKFVEINPAGIKLFGYGSLKEISKIEIKNELFVNPNDYDRYIEDIDKNEQLKDYEVKLKRKDGTEITVILTAIIFRDENGNITAHEGIIRDITEKLNLENQVFQSQKMESIGMLAGGIAHDFNNILTAMNGYAELSLLNLDKKDPNYVRIKNIQKSGKQAENLVKQLLAFGRKQFIETKVCNINNIIKDLESIFKKVVKEDIQFDIDLTEEVNFIKADPVQIQQILVNLIANAGYAINQMNSESNERLITLSTKEIFADDNFIRNHPGTEPGKYIQICVKDTGVGIDKETQGKIFEPFFTTKTEGQGTGLGLATVYGIVKQNNANIYVNSKLKHGTNFEIYWPITKEKLKKSDHSETKVEFEQRCETILFVEDDMNVRQLATDALMSFGYEVYEAEHGKQALDIISQKKLINKIDLLITDMVMPVMGGEELSQKIRELKPDIKIILSSGYTNSHLFSVENKNDSKLFFLSKPYTIPKLEKKIRKVLLN